MKLINKYKSPNFNHRKISEISMIIIHYTSLKNEEEAVSYLCNPINKVSSHYLVSQNGNIYSLVNEKYRAWHAGISRWNNIKDINSISLGIELDFSYSNSNCKFSKKLMKSLCLLVQHLSNKFKIHPSNILGHSDVAPYRKIDPGPKFPWRNKCLRKFSFLPNNIKKEHKSKFIKWFKNYGIINKEKKALFILNFIGYDISKAINNKKNLKFLIRIYQSHYLQENVNGILDKKTIDKLINHILSLILTKDKY